MPLVKFANLDFDQVKQSIKDYIKSNSNFTDYDFEGSNLSVIIDALAYNTYLSSYNANMLSNEVFIDSATLRENIVSLARNIGYTPRSRKAAKANISFTVNVGSSTALTLTLRAGTVATSRERFGNTSFTFTIPADITVPIVNGVATFDNITIFEGNYITENFTVNTNIPNQKFILGNEHIDTSSLVIRVYPTAQDTSFKQYNFKSDLFNVVADSRVYFIQEISDQRYELFFGDGIFGKKLENENYITASYTVTNGEDGNGVSSFVFAGRIFDNNGTLVTSNISALTTNSNSSGGQEIESVDSIRKFSTRQYSTQNRAVTSSDYESLIPRIYPDAESVTVFGGEELEPPRYGRVYVSIKPVNGQYLSATIKDNLVDELRKYKIAGVLPVILDVKYVYIEFNSTVFYDPSLGSNPNYLKSAVTECVENYADSTELNKYGAKFKYSKFTKVIDDCTDAITSNITNIFIRRDLAPVLNAFAEYEICFGNRFHVNPNGYNLKTSGFRVSGIADTVYFSDTPNPDLLTGTIFLFKVDETTQAGTVLKSVGTIDYVKGEILIDPIRITGTSKTNSQGPIIEFAIKPYSNDVIGKQELYLQLDINNSTINMLKDDISSGADISGSRYVAANSCADTGSLIRR
jgi:hypothetical protein